MKKRFSSRLPILRSIAKNLITYGKVTTSEAKAKAAKPFLEKLVLRGKKGTLEAHRSLASQLDKKSAKLLFSILPRFADKKSGFIKMTRLGARRGDRAMQVRLEWAVEKEVKVKNGGFSNLSTKRKRN